MFQKAKVSEMKLITFITLIVFGAYQSVAQEHVNEHPANFVGFFVGNTIIVESGFQIPTVGVEYVREIAPNIGIGIVAEYEFGSHIVQKNEGGSIISEVEREGAFLILPSAFFKLYKGLILTVGYGIELEKHENLAMSKVGLEYKFQMHDPNWIILPSVSWDHTELFDGVVYGATFGYKF